ncbi:hypothetical protein DMA12_47440 [Amycolatopsis balhimycina DSM 5908]|uniref:Uncharacterized protein n=1 Tax=Amycolatopsis balhimycina DSM 5908 TaxID=1081091 RepID=A0A428VUZ8_AMYBA|nr:hypothetical protein [Amycolatopsis balhimycina]RSM34656.1 hypothetical protein DMA12_47440 [Amycolatopsis balhimycina DSM 5908]
MNVSREQRTRLQLVIEWVVWHFGELAGVAGPLVLAAVFTPWFALVSAVVAAGWAVHEVRDHREHARLRAGTGDRKQLPASPATDETTNQESQEGAR